MSRRPLVPRAKRELEKMKNEFANEIGIEMNESYEGSRTSRANGHVGGAIGGLMTKKMIESYERKLIDK
ncbi:MULTISPECIES: alpha/beta-type small acid-soluble spore protein [unclassified Clostridium]|uniref:alpha/beta-type small acid-soluble spore protein n=1 Tax=unclassified Clostridium TaxID=2614128 RepID=UPI00029862C9|nr:MULTISPECIES: alpha/beta-type small acid-soluble spore protein [unclassified Clostridium]EKQ57183.1 MAG: small, acid-soluble spore protein, alpha/beta type [Clostridium sp. Maddingley MBC34-26]